MRHIRTLLASAAAAALAMGLLPTAAHADPVGVLFAPNSGSTTTGTPTTIGYTLDTSQCQPLLGEQTFTVTPIGTNSGPAASIQVSLAKPYFIWIPPKSDYWTFNAAVNGAPCSTQTTPALRSNTVSSSIAVSAPNTAKAGQATTLTATVTAANGAQAGASGTVQFSIVGGGPIGGPVNLNGAVPSVATQTWVPATNGTFQIVATYTPQNSNGYIDVSCGSSCSSAPDQVVVTASGVKVYLSNPPSFVAGAAGTLTAVVSVTPPSGSVTFTVNGAVVGSNVPVQGNGQASALWTPPAAGTYTVNASWIGNNGLTGGAQEQVSVAATPVTGDTITVGPVGQAPWPQNAAVTVPNGSSVTLATRSASGSPVALAEAGPCTLNGTVLSVPDGSGQCRITASSPGGNGYAASSVVYTVNLGIGQQTANVNPPVSGRVNRGKAIVLEGPGQGDTNAGQNIVWRVQKGSKSVCKLGFPADGSVTVTVRKRGQCTVVGSAPGIPGQWSPYRISRTYRA